MNDKPLLRYRLLLILLSPWLAFVTVRQAIKAGGKRFLLQRFGFAHQVQTDSAPIWVHCASVGEVSAVRPLIDELQAQFPHTPLILSTNTPSGADTVARFKWPNVVHRYLPVDFRYAVTKVLAINRPRALLIMETEIWPNLTFAANKLNVPIIIVNALSLIHI